MTTTPDARTLFVNIQHPGERTTRWGTPDANPHKVSNWPDHHRSGRPRSATVAVRREEGWGRGPERGGPDPFPASSVPLTRHCLPGQRRAIGPMEQGGRPAQRVLAFRGQAASAEGQASEGWAAGPRSSVRYLSGLRRQRVIMTLPLSK